MENQEQTEKSKQPELGISDLQNIRTLLDVCVRRGVFNPTELSSVGAVYDRLNNFLIAINDQQSSENSQNSPAAEA